MEKIYKATIYQFESEEQTDITVRYIIDDKTMQNIVGILYNDAIIDIETGIQYPILKREKQHTYLKQNEKIELGKFYVGRIEPCQFTHMDSNSIQIYLKAMRRLLKERKNLGKVKVKK